MYRDSRAANRAYRANWAQATSGTPSGAAAPRAYRKFPRIGGLLPIIPLILSVSLLGCMDFLDDLLTGPGTPVESVEVEPTSASVELGSSLQLSAVVRDQEGQVLGDAEIAWTTSDPAVASVDDGGRVTAHGLGDAVIVATSEGESGTSTINVVESGFQLLVSTSPDRSNPESLEGQVLTGAVYIFTVPEEGVDSVEFILDGQSERWQVLAPFDFGGGPGDDPNPWLTSTVPDGEHTIEARIFGVDVTAVSAGFTVSNGDAPPSGNGEAAFPGAQGFGAPAL